MKKIIILISLITVIVLISCQKELSTQTEQKLDLSIILSDSNWVEVTDTIPVDIRCIDRELIGLGIIIQSENDYKQLWQNSVETKTLPKDSIFNPWGDCSVYYPTKIDFENRTAMGMSITTGPSNRTRNIYSNDKLKEYLFILHIEYKPGIREARGDGYFAWSSVPKIPSDYKVSFDTTITYKR